MYERKRAGWLAIIAVCALIAVCAAVMSCTKKESAASAPGQSAPKTLRVAVILKTLSSPYWQTVLSGAQQGGKELGVEISAFGPPTEDGVEEQINMVENAISDKFDAIVFSPCQPPAAVSVLAKAKNANIPVVVIDTPMPAEFTDYVTYIGSNNYQIGVLGAQEMVKALPPGGKVTILEGAPGNVAMTDRANGAEKVFKDAGIIIESRQPANSDRERAFSIIQNVLQKGDIDGVFSANDDQAEGAYRALTQNGKQALVMGVDGNQSAKESVRDGGLFGTVAQSASEMGRLGVLNAVDYVKGNTNIPKSIDAPTPVITKDNVAQFL